MGNCQVVNGKYENAKTLTQTRRSSSCKINENVAAVVVATATVALAAAAGLGPGKAPLDQRKLNTHTLRHWQTCHQLAKRRDPANRIEEQAVDAPRVATPLAR